MQLINPLPAPGLAQLGNKLPQSNEEIYTALGVFDGGVVYRRAGQRLVIHYDDGYQLVLENQCSAIFENNAYISPNGFLIFIYRQGLSKWYVYSYNLIQRSLVRDTFLVDDPGFPSVAIDEFLDRIIYYKAYKGPGEIGYVYSFTYSNNILSKFFFGATPSDVIIHLAFKPAATGFYRTIVDRTNGNTKITEIPSGATDAELYNYVNANGETLVQDINSDDVWYPVVDSNNDYLFVLNNDCTEISAWSLTTPNTQSLSPVVIDTRDFLYHANFAKIGYPRLFTTDKNIVYDQRTLIAIDSVGLAPATDYPICSGGLPLPYPTGSIQFPDRQTIYLQSNSSTRGVVLNDFYNFDDSESCSIDNVANEGLLVHANLLDSDKPDIEGMTGLVEQVLVPPSVGRQVYLSDNLIIWRENDIIGGAVSEHYFNGVSITADFRQLGILRNGDIYYLKTIDELIIFDASTDTIVSRTAIVASLDFLVHDAFIWRNKAYFRTSNSITVVEVLTNTITSVAVDFSIGEINTVLLLPNPFDGELYLHDLSAPTNLYRITINLFTENYARDYAIFTELVDSNLPVGNRLPNANDREEIMVWVNKEDIFYRDGFSNVSQMIIGKRKLIELNVPSIRGTLPTDTFADMYVNVFNNYIYEYYSNGLYFYNGDEFYFIPVQQMTVEATPNSIFGLLTTLNFDTVFGSIDNKIMALNVSGRLYSFSTYGRRAPADPFGIVPDATHSFVAILNNASYSVSKEEIPAGGYNYEYIHDTSIDFSNDKNRITAYKRQNNRIAYNVMYYCTEQELTFFMNCFHTQCARIGDPTERFELYFRDLFRDGEVYEVILTDVSWEWYHEGVFEVNIKMETI